MLTLLLLRPPSFIAYQKKFKSTIAAPLNALPRPGSPSLAIASVVCGCQGVLLGELTFQRWSLKALSLAGVDRLHGPALSLPALKSRTGPSSRLETRRTRVSCFTPVRSVGLASRSGLRLLGCPRSSACRALSSSSLRQIMDSTIL